MAFLNLDKFVNDLAMRYRSYEKIYNNTEAERLERQLAHFKCMEILTILTMFYERLKESSRLVSQIAHCRKTIESLNPDYASGYFNTRSRG